MRVNKALIDRVLDVPPINDNAVMMYNRLLSLIEEYNRIAKDKGLPVKKIPAYSNNINCTLISRLMVSILKDIDRVKNMEGENNEDNSNPKIAIGAEFTTGIITELPNMAAWKDGLWYYIQDGENICVYAVTEEIKARMNGGTELVLDYDDMPYELLIDKSGEKWKVNKYAVDLDRDTFGLFGNHYTQDDWNNNVVDKLTSLTLQGWTNKNVTNMSYMFYSCRALTTLDVSSFDTSTVTDMHDMFTNCTGFTALDLRGFNTSSVTDMRNMFYMCGVLTTLDVSSFDTRSVTDMNSMFTYCASLTALDLSSFNTSAVTDMECMFYCCSALTTLVVSSFDTSTVTDMNNMFADCGALTTLNLNSFNTSAVTDMNNMFSGCRALTVLTLGANFNVPPGYDSSKKTNISPSSTCTITMNKSMYDAFKQYDLSSYTFSPDSWNASGATVQEITVTPPASD